MRRERNIFIIGATAVLAALTLSSTAFAATPRQIYSDVAQHGRLTQNYSAADLARARQDASVAGYGSGNVLPVLQVVTLKPVNRPSGTLGATKTLAKPATCSTARAAVANGSATAGQRAQARSCSSVAPLQATRQSSTLPFTGMQLSLYLLLGLVLISSGLLLRKTAGQKSRI